MLKTKIIRSSTLEKLEQEINSFLDHVSSVEAMNHFEFAGEHILILIYKEK